MAIPDQIDAAESGGNPNAANPNSSARGLGQFIAPTFLSVMKRHFPALVQGKSDAEILAMRANPAISHAATGAYASDNQAYLAKNGLPVTPGTTYLAHFAGPEGAAKILQADPSAPVSEILGAAAIKANPFLEGMTAQGLRAWAAKKMGTAVPQAGVSNNAPAPAAGQSPGLPTNILPQGHAPVFAQGAPPQATAPRPAVQPMAAPQAPAAAPIFAPPPTQIDLAPLRAMLAARGVPIFPKAV